METVFYVVIAFLVVVCVVLLFQNLLMRATFDRKLETEIEAWKQDEEKEIRKDAISRSRATMEGKVSEHFVPFFDDFPFNPADARFLGSPIDFVVFEGLDDGEENLWVTFIEAKTGQSGLTKRERRVRDAIQAGRVRWVMVRRREPGIIEYTGV